MRVHVIAPDEDREQLTRPAAVSLVGHTALFAFVLLYNVFSPPPFQFGDPEGAAGSAVAVTVVDGIPINVPRAEPNPVANPVQHQVPAPQEIPAPPAPTPEPEVVREDPRPPEPLEEPKPEPRRQPRPKVQKSAPETKPNQVTSSTGAQASSPVFTGTQETAGAGVGMGRGNPFGQGFAWYAAALQRRLSEEWARTLGQAAGGAGKPVVVQFGILQDGSIRDVRVVESSGNRSLDYSAHRAVTNINPFQRLPPGLRRSSVTVEIYFQLQ